MGIVKSLERGLGALCAFGFVVKPLVSQLFRSGLGVLLEHGESLGMKQWSESHSYGLSENHAHGLAQLPFSKHLELQQLWNAPIGHLQSSLELTGLQIAHF